MESRTNQQIIGDCNALALKLYALMGFNQGHNYKMYEATHPQEKLCWEMAMVAYEHVGGTEVSGVLDEFQQEA